MMKVEGSCNRDISSYQDELAGIALQRERFPSWMKGAVYKIHLRSTVLYGNKNLCQDEGQSDIPTNGLKGHSCDVHTVDNGNVRQQATIQHSTRSVRSDGDHALNAQPRTFMC